MGQLVAPRSSTLCAGCPHLGTYWALKQAVYRQPGTPIINGDIGCYEQGGYGLFSRQVEPSDAPSQRLKVTSPYEMLDTIYVMGSGVGMAQGQSHVGHEGPVVAVAGDSTFFHATLPAVVNAVTNHARVTFVVMDNSWTCMTGHQVSPTTGTDTVGQPTTTLDIAGVCHALGVPFVRVTDAYDVKGTTAAFKEALTQPGVAVVVAKRECALQVQRRERRRGEAKSTVNENCNGCRVCLQIGCPAITWDAERKRAGVDRLLCVDCTICHQICPRSAMGIPPAGDTSLCL
ncbi:MAG TPA: hypothetical protein GX513_01470 [Firmicutes bacterium]|nr:hypothetical protein [Bacillota bacterium]